jgi:tripartite ATP-independent transporter DctM subunit
MLAVIFVVFLVVLLLGFDVGLSMVLAAVVGMLIHPTNPVDLVMIPLTMATAVNTSALVTIPLFVLAAEVMNRGGLTERLINWSLVLVGHVRGSLSQVSIISNLIMAGVSGSAVADAAATGGLLIPAMRREGYPEGYSGAVIAAGALLGPIIPPSIPMIIYAVMANESVLKLFLGGIVPGVLLAGGFMAICYLIAVRHKYPFRPRETWGALLRSTKYSIAALAMPAIILVGLRYGWVTDIEASGVAALYALLVSVLVYRSIGLRELARVFLESSKSAAAILFLLAAAGPFGWLLAESKANEALAQAILSITTDPLLGLLLINALLLVVGCFLEPLPAMVVFLPSLLPIGAALGIDPVHLGVVMVLNLMIGMLTPPVGLLLFVVAGIGKIPLAAVIRASLPFLGWSLVVLALATFFPFITTGLSRLLVS